MSYADADGSSGRLLYLSRRDVLSVGLSMAEILDAVESGFREMGLGRVEMPPKPGIHPGGDGDNFIHAMPAYIPAMRAAGVKWVSGYPGNQARGLPYISGLLTLNDPDTGIPVAVMDCSWITAKRTGAASAVSARYLARPESSTIGIVACGVQGHSNLEAMNLLFPLERVYAFDPDAGRAEQLAAFAGGLGLEAEVVDEPRKAVAGSDIVVTSGPILKVPHATIQKGWMRPGTFASLVDFDSYFSRDALAEVDKWTTDQIDQYNHYRDVGGFFQSCPEVYAELGELVVGTKSGRQDPDEINAAANLGLAVDDIAVAPLVHQRAIEGGIGTWVEL